MLYESVCQPCPGGKQLCTASHSTAIQGLHLSGGTGQEGLIKFTVAGGFEMTASGCVDMNTFCGRYRRTTCGPSNATVVSKVRLTGTEDVHSHFIQLHEDGTLAFTGPGCVTPVAEWSADPTTGIRFNGNTADGFIARSNTGIKLYSRHGFSVLGASMEPQCQCSHGHPVTGANCTTHGDHHCANCAAGFTLTGKLCS